MADAALRVALALWRQPSLRPALRGQPLPDDVGTLIELVGGAADRLAAAAARVGETADDVLEASRFYLREVMLFDEGDAYRLLGLSPQASASQLKAHHRALQHWLHPDRRGNDWESAFAARINTAYSQLRTTERRQDYDRQRDAGTGASHPRAQRVLVPGWRSDATPGPRRPAAWALLALAAALCAWLLVLVGRQALTPPPEWDPVASADDPANPSPLAPLAMTADRMVAAPSDAAATSTLRDAPPSPPGRADAAPSGASTAPSMPNSAASDGIRAARDADDARVAATVPLTAASLPVPGAMSTAPAPAAASDEDPAAGAAETPVVPRNAVALAAIPAAAGRVAAPRAAAAAAAPAVAPAPVVDAARVLAAQRRGREITGFLRSAGGRAPPIWNSVAALDSAEAARGRLARGAAAGRLRFGEPDWRVASTRATMTAPLHAGRDAGAGRLRVELAWRNDMWLVDSLHLDTPALVAP